MVPGRPRMQESNSCFHCLKQFKLHRPRHHCRNCGCSCCGPCSAPHKIRLPWFGYKAPQRICAGCAHELGVATSWTLKDYVLRGWMTKAHKTKWV
ncbi:hypothetical protein Ae201684P_015769 [Aphanomyces euteiches]|uniref:FYVE-type domain-containing protein n=1 Tax=Aphanomyces euteiches TaxID=100861 RepID=A0A6G0WIQ5_9STRA|nr:hypothetical protein Ae201684_014843 [Aphanomyces euteiches]KAH9072696.1 hypothetical protein Ae201684P_015769 [Aphanomyces euteiches]KAH9151413.1 hypothetical protein AeRB84_005967 [Aphanomyces euteiches]